MSVKVMFDNLIYYDDLKVGTKSLTDSQRKVDVSIVMTYYERKTQLINTIKSFSMNEYEGVELIIIDDGSVEQCITADELSCFAPELDIRVIRIKSLEKIYYNPCIPFNIGFAKAQGNIIIIQNAECIHVDNIVAYCLKNLDDSRYFSFGCFSIDHDAMVQISNKEKFDREYLRNFISTDKIVPADGANGWYNHSVFRPVAYHFTAAITKKNLHLLKGFDTRYAYGIGHDDNEILERIQRSGMKISILDDVLVLHQWHYSTTKHPRFDKLFTRNHLLLKFVTKKEKKVSYSRLSIRYIVFIIMLPVLFHVSKFLKRNRV